MEMHLFVAMVICLFDIELLDKVPQPVRRKVEGRLEGGAKGCASISARQPLYFSLPVFFPFLNLALHLPLMLPAVTSIMFLHPPPSTLSYSNSPRALSTSLATNSQQPLALSDAGKDFDQMNSVDLFVDVVLFLV